MLFALIILTGVHLAVPANAETTNSVTKQSAYDDQSPDNLSVRLDAQPAVCDKDMKSGSGTGWASQITFYNLAQTTSASVSFVENTGGTLGPGQATSHVVRSDGNGSLKATVGFKFDVQGAGDEAISIIIPAPKSGCGTDHPAVNCFLNNYTNPSVQNMDGSWPIGTTFSLKANVTDPESQVTHYVFSFILPGSKSNDTKSGPNPSVSWTPAKTGTWKVVAQLFDSQGNEVTPTGDCSVKLVVAQAVAAPPVVPPRTPNVPTGNGVITRPVVSSIADSTTATLPVTGSSTVWLTIMSFVLIVIGWSLIKLSRWKQKPVVDPTWSLAMRTLGENK